MALGVALRVRRGLRRFGGGRPLIRAPARARRRDLRPGRCTGTPTRRRGMGVPFGCHGTRRYPVALTEVRCRGRNLSWSDRERKADKRCPEYDPGPDSRLSTGRANRSSDHEAAPVDNAAHDVGVIGHAAVSRPETVGRKSAVRLLLKPALSRGWRDSETLQFGTVQRYAGVLEHVDRPLRDFLGLIDGTRDRPALLAAGERAGLGREPTEELLDTLERTGLLDDADAAGAALTRFPRPHRELLGPDLASLSLVHSGPGAGPAVLARRAGQRVEVRGAGRVGAAIAAVLSAGGTGTVTVTDNGRVGPADCSPAGLPPSDLGRLRATAAREAVQRASGRRPGPDARRSQDQRPPDLVVLAPRDGSGAFAGGTQAARELLRAGTPHLYVGVVEEIGVVGPLVTPGVSACGHCLVLAREDEDAGWPRLLAQIADEGPGRARTPACDTALATAVAGLAALHVQLHLDGVRPPSVDGWCELSATDGMSRRLRLRGHPDCGCLWQPMPPA
ncbi:hypothetical protein C2142_14420 [Streptomyces sp. CB01881]|nr:hypothetical protein C2142_14420 [Streptomyces sp. CB01881]